MRKQTQYYVLKAGLILMICICFLMLGMTWKQDRMLEKILHEHALALFELILYTRQWNSEYGGVFVEKKDGMISNPYLENPDITDINGKVYTKKNPALMTREISNISKFKEDFTFHITSLKLKNPDNAPDDWEKIALLEFEKGETEKIGIMKRESKMLYRLIKPLYVEASCLVCHKDQDYKVGEVRGGISVNLPYNTTLQAIRKNNFIMIALLVLFITILAATFYVFIWKVMDTLEKQSIQLENLNQTKNKFLGMCAHDLRNPLSSIMGYSELILDKNQGTLSEDHTMFIRRIHSSGLRMLEMVNTFLDISVIESGRLELHLSKGAVKPLLEDHIQISRLLANKKNITIHSSLHDTPDISFDNDRISQVFDNIISNAIKYSPQGSSIYFSLDSTNGYIRVSVRDEGPGISKEEQEKLFHEFQRLSPKPTGGEKSTGLGLAIVKKIIDYHKGKIEVESQPGKGSTFIVKLPLKEP